MELEAVFLEGLARRAAAAREVTLPAPGDAYALRAFMEAGMPIAYRSAGPAPDVSFTEEEARTDDGERLALRWYTRSGHSPGSAIVYVHGGGMIAGTIELYDPIVAQYVEATGVPFLSVEFRRAPDVEGDTSARDVLAAIRWLIGAAGRLGVDPERIALMGDSGGGGIAAGAAILARDLEVPLAAQILIFPMLDDRNSIPDPHIAAVLHPVFMWTYEKNRTCWSAVLGSRFGTDQVSPYAAPARLTHYEGLAPAYIEVGSLDIFRDESIRYASALLQAGVDTELHVHKGAPHGHDWLAPDAPLADRWRADRMRVIGEI